MPCKAGKLTQTEQCAIHAQACRAARHNGSHHHRRRKRRVALAKLKSQALHMGTTVVVVWHVYVCAFAGFKWKTIAVLKACTPASRDTRHAMPPATARLSTTRSHTYVGARIDATGTCTSGKPSGPWLRNIYHGYEEILSVA